MSDVGQIEGKAQERVVPLISEQLGYDDLGSLGVPREQLEYRDVAARAGS